VSDGIIALRYKPEVFVILKAKKGSDFIVLEATLALTLTLTLTLTLNFALPPILDLAPT
jgi:hypothetical protein